MQEEYIAEWRQIFCKPFFPLPRLYSQIRRKRREYITVVDNGIPSQ